MRKDELQDKRADERTSEEADRGAEEFRQLLEFLTDKNSTTSSADAIKLFFEKLDDYLYYFRAHGEDRQRFLELLLPIGAEGRNPGEQARLLHALGKGKMFLGDTEGAAANFKEGYEAVRALPEGVTFAPFKIKLDEGDKNELTLTKPVDVAIMILLELVHAHRLSGHFKDAEQAARQALVLIQVAVEPATDPRVIGLYRSAQAVAFYRLGMVLSARGETGEAEKLYLDSLAFWENAKISHFCGFICTCLAQQALWMNKLPAAEKWLSKAMERFKHDPDPRSINTMTAHRLLGTIAMEQGNLSEADTRLSEGIALARRRGRIEEELLSRVQLAKLKSLRKNIEEARGNLEKMGETYRRSYPPFYADAYNVLASIEHKMHRKKQAVDAATAAFKEAWCDGPPFAYIWAMKTAEHNLLNLGSGLPATAQGFRPPAATANRAHA